MPNIISNSIQAHVAFFDNEKKTYKYLILKRSENEKIFPNAWQAITGWIENGETAIKAALREIKEETNLRAIKMWYLPYIAQFYAPSIDSVCFSPVFGAIVENSDFEISSEHSDSMWLEYEEMADKLVFPSQLEGFAAFDKIIKSGDNTFLLDLREYL